MLKNKNIIISLLVLAILLSACVYILVNKNSIMASTNTEAISTGDVLVEDNNKINLALDNFVTIQKQVQAEYKILEDKVNTAKQQLDNTIVEIITKNKKDWRLETIAEKDPKLRSYKFIKREQPLPQPTVGALEEKKEEKK